MRHLIDPADFTLEETLSLMDLADRIHEDPAAYRDVAARKRLATLFYEPSTRTRLSFEAAMLNLGGQVLGFPDAGVSSASKGETVADTIRVVSCVADIAAMRHPKEGAPLRASRYSRIPVINAGDGGHSHPTQTLLDMMTIRQRKGRLDHLTIGFCGDLKFGRTVHSLIKSLSRLPGMKFVLISPEELRVPDYIISEILEPNGIEYVETRSLEEALPQLDILYMTRVQRERFFNEEDYIRLKNSYVLTKEKLDLAPADMAVLHPLPRVNEITLDVDDDPRAAYFDQVQNGVHMRMALIMTLLDMMTVRQRKGRLDHLTIGFCGDLKFGRTVHSLIKSLSRLPGMRFVLVSPEELRVPDYIISEILEPNGIEYVETRSLEEALPQLDILYMTRVQRERFFNEEDYIRLKNSYVLTKAKLDLAPADMAVLHPLPRVNEITLDVDDDPRAAYFDQVQNGVHMRMALIMTLLGLKDPKTGEVAFDVEG